jgi:hypothetical protein
MTARRLGLMVVALLWVVCILATGAGFAVAATQFGSEGFAPGQFRGKAGVALDQATGDVYVADQFNYRVDKFDDAGSFLYAWGWRVNEASPANELQTCITSCQSGVSGSAPGQYGSEGPQGVSVDDDALSASYGDVYVVDWENDRVEKFDSSGKFLLTIGGEVNETTGGNVCLAGEKCKRGTQGTADAQFEWAYRADGYIAVGPGGALYVGDKARVEVFESSGAWRENISLSGLSSTGKVRALAVNSAGDIFVNDEGVAGVRELEPNGTEKSTQFDAGSTSVEAITLDASGDLFVGDSGGGFHVLKYDPAGTELDSFGSNTAGGANGMAVSDALSELYVSNGDGSNVWILTLPLSGPVIEPGSESATSGLKGTETLEATVDPQGSETEYRFEYVDEAHFQASGYADASSTPSASIAASFEDQPASVHLTGLSPGGSYHYRIIATSSDGTATGADETFTTTPPALVEGPFATNVASTSATLTARVDPLGASTSYRLEYGTSTSYGHVLSGNAGEGASYVFVSYHQQELEPDTTYHYRIVTINEVGTVESADHSFTTQTAGRELTLLDGRAWELVSPADKKGALVYPSHYATQTMMQASEDGTSITYLSLGPLGSDVQGNSSIAQVLSSRGLDGWTSQDIESPNEKPTEIPSSDYEGGISEDRYFSSDLALAAVEPVETEGEKRLSPEATEPTVYLRDNARGTYHPLVTAANVPPGTKFGFRQRRPVFLDATPDMSHVIISSPEALTTNAKQVEPANPNSASSNNLYEWTGGELQLVNILPKGKATVGEAVLGRNGSIFAHALSNDGRRIVWEEEEGSNRKKSLYMRDMSQGVTVQIGGPKAMYQTASADGSKIFYSEIPRSNPAGDFSGTLWVYDADTGTQTDLTVPSKSGESPGVQPGLMGASEDGSHVYFLATGVLAPGGTSGEDNLYLLSDTASGWQTTFIATLSKEDERSWVGNASFEIWSLNQVSSRVSPNGRYVAFMSERSLTGYDNIDVVGGQPDEEVYLYDSVTGRLTCTSCDPTGARPAGVFDPPSHAEFPLVDPIGAWSALSGTASHWLAGSIPDWAPDDTGSGLYQPRYLSDGGRLFFDSPVALVPQDTNGVEDVYEYEPAGVGDCSSSSVTFLDAEDGCVNLLSAGTSPEESAFLDASVSGDDVFFVTTSKLVSDDYDSSYDMYDARACSASAPCVAAPVSPPECSTADSCKPAPAPQPTSFGSPASATFVGQGNVSPVVSRPAVKSAKHKAKVKRRKKRKVRAKRGRAGKVIARRGASVRTHRNGGAKS